MKKNIFLVLSLSLLLPLCVQAQNFVGSALDEMCDPRILKALGVPATAIGTVTNLAASTVSQADKLVKDTLKVPQQAGENLKKEFASCALQQPGLNAILSTAKLGEALSGLIGNGLGVSGLATQAAKECANQAQDALKDKIQEGVKEQLKNFTACLANIPGLPALVGQVIQIVKLLQQLQKLVAAASNVVKSGGVTAAMSCVSGVLPNTQELIGLIGQCTGIGSGLSSVWDAYSSIAGLAGTPKQLAQDLIGCAQNGVGVIASSAFGPLADSVTGLTGGLGNMVGGLASGASALMKLPSAGKALNDLAKSCAILRKSGKIRRR